MGAYKLGVRLVYIRWEKQGCKLVVNTKKIRYLSLPLANVQTLKIGEWETSSYFSDEEIKYTFLDVPIDEIKVLAT